MMRMVGVFLGRLRLSDTIQNASLELSSAADHDLRSRFLAGLHTRLKKALKATAPTICYPPSRMKWRYARKLEWHHACRFVQRIQRKGVVGPIALTPSCPTDGAEAFGYLPNHLTDLVLAFPTNGLWS